MNRFSQFDIKVPERGLEGKKIKISKVFNREITVHAYKIEDTKVEVFREKGSDKCLHLQISFADEMYVVFTSSFRLMEAIKQVPGNKFPFTTTIIEENNNSYKFT